MSNSWSGLRKQLENEFLCPKLRGRIQYFVTHYHSAPDDDGRIAIRVDGKEYIMGNPYAYYGNGYAVMENRMEQHITYMMLENQKTMVGFYLKVMNGLLLQDN